MPYETDISMYEQYNKQAKVLNFVQSWKEKGEILPLIQIIIEKHDRYQSISNTIY